MQAKCNQKPGAPVGEVVRKTANPTYDYNHKSDFSAALRINFIVAFLYHSHFHAARYTEERIEVCS